MRRALYHFTRSPYSRRVRLALAHKSLEVELREARDQVEHAEALKRLHPLRTAPLLVEEDGSVIGDSGAIVHYLDRAYGDRGAPLWPTDRAGARAAFGAAALIDGALDHMVDLATRYHTLSAAADWPRVRDEIVSRCQGAFDALASQLQERARPTVCSTGWSAADIWIVTAVLWLEGLPARAATFEPAARLVALGVETPRALRNYVDAHRERADVKALDESA